MAGVYYSSGKGAYVLQACKKFRELRVPIFFQVTADCLNVFDLSFVGSYVCSAQGASVPLEPFGILCCDFLHTGCNDSFETAAQRIVQVPAYPSQHTSCR